MEQVVVTKAKGTGGRSESEAAALTKQYDDRFANGGIRRFLTGRTARHGDQEFVMPDFTVEVNRGASLLDERLPGWWRTIDTSALDLRDENMCILGQTWYEYARMNDIAALDVTKSNFRTFMSKLLGSDPIDENREEASRYGFNIAGQYGIALNWQGGFRSANDVWSLAWERLTETWLELIRARQEETRDSGDMKKTRYEELVRGGMSIGDALVKIATE